MNLELLFVSMMAVHGLLTIVLVAFNFWNLGVYKWSLDKVNRKIIFRFWIFSFIFIFIFFLAPILLILLYNYYKKNRNIFTSKDKRMLKVVLINVIYAFFNCFNFFLIIKFI